MEEVFNKWKKKNKLLEYNILFYLEALKASKISSIHNPNLIYTCSDFELFKNPKTTFRRSCSEYWPQQLGLVSIYVVTVVSWQHVYTVSSRG